MRDKLKSLNPAVYKLHSSLDPFNYAPFPPMDDRELIVKDIINFRNGRSYEGEWDLNETQHGRGVKLYEDGAIHEGYWRGSKRNGRGRTIFADGQVYNGNWKNGKQHGYGE